MARPSITQFPPACNEVIMENWFGNLIIAWLLDAPSLFATSIIILAVSRPLAWRAFLIPSPGDLPFRPIRQTPKESTLFSCVSLLQKNVLWCLTRNLCEIARLTISDYRRFYALDYKIIKLAECHVD